MQFLLERLVSLSLVEDVPIIRQSILRQIALITNKHLAPDQIQYAIDILWDLTKGLGNTTLTENSVRIAFWIAKGLVSRLVKTEEVLERLLGLLPNSSFGLISGRGFGILLAPDEIFSKENGVTIRLLAKQKIFNFCIPKIASDFRQAESSAKANFLHALSGILQYMPTDILMTEIDSLLPLLLQSLDLEDADVKAATVESLMVIGQDSPKAIEGHTSSLVNRLLKCSVIGPSNSAVGLLRIEALDLNH